MQHILPRLSHEDEVYSQALPTLKTQKCPQEVKFLCARALKGKMTGVNLAEASQPSAGSSTHWAPFHRGTHREGLVLRSMCRSVPAGRSEMIGLPRDAAQKTHCFPTAKASTGMQYGAAGNFTAYLYRKSSNPRKAPACRLTLWWEFRKGADRELDLTGIKLK